ncbi:MAG: aminotransferase class V-fold PLP-dependent enzyme [bacterium]
MVKEEVYLDNATTTWPKPPSMIQAMIDFNESVGANPVRGAYDRAKKSSEIVFTAREELAEMFNIDDSTRIMFCINCTAGTNAILWSMLNEGDHIIISSMEHNAVLRPVYELNKRNGITFSIAQASSEGIVSPDEVRKHIKKNTKIIAVLHSSNVCGAINPINEIGKIAKENNILFMVDNAQTAGSFSIDVKRDNVSLMAFSGHKGLMGPLGTGAFYISPELNPPPFICGGTGILSHLEGMPDCYPERFEPGTQNIIGISGLLSSIRFINDYGMDRYAKHKQNLAKRMIDGISQIKGVRYFGPKNIDDNCGVVSVQIDGIPTDEAGRRLYSDYGIMIRAGLHCAPHAHKTLGTFEGGTVRFSFGLFNTEDDVDWALRALSEISSSK